MMHQRPCVAEHDQAADEARGEGLDLGIGGGAGAAAISHQASSSVPTYSAMPVARWMMDSAIVSVQR